MLLFCCCAEEERQGVNILGLKEQMSERKKPRERSKCNVYN